MLIHKSVETPSSLRYNIDVDGDAAKHDEEGRVICATFEHFVLLMTYTPNNGGKKVVNEQGVSTVSFAKRQDWDAQITKFVQVKA